MGKDLNYRLQSPYLQKLLESHQYQGNRNDCGPCTVTTIINALSGYNIDSQFVSKEMNNPVWRKWKLIIRRIPNNATFPWGLVDIFRINGFFAQWQFFFPINRLLSDLQSGSILIPFLISWHPFWAHMMTLVAWDNIDGWGFINTQFPNKTIFWLKRDEFQKLWNHSGHLIVILTP